MVVLEAYDGKAWGWSRCITVYSGNYERYIEYELIHVEDDPARVLDEIVERLGYKVGRRWSNATSVFIELPYARNPQRVAEKVKKLLEEVRA